VTTTYVPAHAPGTCNTCDWVRSVAPVWAETPAPPDCSECVELPGGGHSHNGPAPLATQTGLAKPAAMHPATVPAIEGVTVHLPSATDSEGRHPPVARPRTTRRPGSS
jgi:hypothetical protein